MPDLLTPEECYDALLPELHALMSAIQQAPTNTPCLALSMLYGLFVFTVRAFEHAHDPMTPQTVADLLVGIEDATTRAAGRPTP